MNWRVQLLRFRYLTRSGSQTLRLDIFQDRVAFNKKNKIRWLVFNASVIESKLYFFIDQLLLAQKTKKLHYKNKRIAWLSLLSVYRIIATENSSTPATKSSPEARDCFLRYMLLFLTLCNVDSRISVTMCLNPPNLRSQTPPLNTQYLTPAHKKRGESRVTKSCDIWILFYIVSKRVIDSFYFLYLWR